MPLAVAPEAVSVKSGRSGREIVRIPLGRVVQSRNHAPYLVIHRRHLQQALVEAVQATPGHCAPPGRARRRLRAARQRRHLAGRTAQGLDQEHGIALIGADGLWSPLRTALGDRRPPQFADRTAWRAMLPAKVLSPNFARRWCPSGSGMMPTWFSIRSMAAPP